MTFNTVQSDLLIHNEKKIIKKTPLDESKYDKEDVGPMFIIKLADETELLAFQDEISMDHDDFKDRKRILKREAKIRFDNNEPVFVGGKTSNGEGAIWDISLFKSEKTTKFEEVCSFFKRHYCTGPGRIVYMCFYVSQ